MPDVVTHSISVSTRQDSGKLVYSKYGKEEKYSK